MLVRHFQFVLPDESGSKPAMALKLSLPLFDIAELQHVHGIPGNSKDREL